MLTYNVYYVEPLNSHTNAVVIAFLEQKAVDPESQSLLCADCKEHLVWNFPANDYEILKESAGESVLYFRSWVEIIKGEKPMLFETVEGNVVVSAVDDSLKSPHAEPAESFYRRPRPELEILVSIHCQELSP
jgi:hypothetical protein